MVEFENVAFAYTAPNGETRRVAEDVSFYLGRGEMAYLIGPSGSGKSTLMRLCYMEQRPDSGHIAIGDYDSATIKPDQVPYLRRQIGVVFQDFQLLPDRNALENVAFALYVTGKTGRLVHERALQCLARVGLSHRTKAMPHELSGGEQQRVCIARALANQPTVLLADEPTGNLDPGVAEEVQELLVRLHRQGMSVLMATHDYRLVKRYPARTLALSKGRIAEIDPESL